MKKLKMREKKSTKVQIKGKKEKIKFHKRAKKAGSIKHVLIVSYIFFAVVPLVLVNLYSSNQSKVTIKGTSSELVIEMVKQTIANIDYYTEAIENSMTRIIINDLNASTNNLINEYSIAVKK